VECDVTLPEFCNATVVVDLTVYTCDREENHEGDHGGVYPGARDGNGEAEGNMVDVHVSWTP